MTAEEWAKIIGATASGTATVIGATRGTPGVLYPTSPTSPPVGQTPPASPATTAAGNGKMSTGSLLLLGGLVLVSGLAYAGAMKKTHEPPEHHEES